MRYTGQIKNKLPHGFGTLEMDNGDVYVGMFAGNKFNGNGNYVFKNGNKYIGAFKNHLFHGEGKIVYTSGKTIMGEFFNGKLIGKMKVESVNGICEGNVFEGKFEGKINYQSKDRTLICEKFNIQDQKPEGSGILTLIDGKKGKCTFSGQWKEGKRTGNGVLECSNDMKYAGYWVESKFEGKGTLIRSNGSSYEGSFLNNQFSGKGKFFLEDNTIVQCSNWSKNKPSGLVKILFSSGNEYVGYLLNGKPEGRGTMRYKNWWFYDGHWKNGVFEGNGDLYFPNGHIFCGHFQAGKPSGDGYLHASILGFHREKTLLPSFSTNPSPSPSLSSLDNIIPSPVLQYNTASSPTPSPQQSPKPILYVVSINGQWEGLKGMGRVLCLKSMNSTEFEKEMDRAKEIDAEKKKEKKPVKTIKDIGKERQTAKGDALYEKMVDLLYTPVFGVEWVLTEKGHVLYYQTDKVGDKEVKKVRRVKKVKKGKKKKKKVEEVAEEDDDEEEEEDDNDMEVVKEKRKSSILGNSFDNIGVLKEEGFKGEKRIGNGGFGEVYVAKYFGGTVAYKMLTQQLSTEAVQDFKREVITMSRLRHPNIIFFVGYTPPPNLRIVMEYADGGSLHDLIYKTPAYAEGLPPRVFLDAACQVASGMAYLSSERIIHKDLKPMNVLIQTNSVGDRTYKIADFGLSKLRKHEQTFILSKGTPQYSPPEAFTDERCTDRVDVYSYGIMLWEMWAREFPFAKLSLTQLYGSIFRQERPKMPAVPATQPYLAEYVALIEACWQHEASKRPAFSEVLNKVTHIAEAEQVWREKEGK